MAPLKRESRSVSDRKRASGRTKKSLNLVCDVKRILCLLVIFSCGELAFSEVALINHVEGTAVLNGEQLSNEKTAAFPDSGVLNTEEGRVEVLLTPGVFLRMDSHSSLTMILRSPTRANLNLTKGKVLIEVVHLGKNDIRVSIGGCSAVPAGAALYELDASEKRLQVYEGQVLQQCPVGNVHLGRGYASMLDSGLDPREQRFDTNSADALYAWSAQAAEYEAEASYGSALKLTSIPVGNAWYWNDRMRCWTFIPRGGIIPGLFGWAFAAPLDLRRALILLGSASHYPAVADRNNLPRIFPQRASATTDISTLPRIHPPPSPPALGMYPGVPEAPIFIPH